MADDQPSKERRQEGATFGLKWEGAVSVTATDYSPHTRQHQIFNCWHVKSKQRLS